MSPYFLRDYRWLGAKLLTLALIVCSLIHRPLNALIKIPNNVRVDSEVAYNQQQKFDLFEVEEFINGPDGSVHVRVTDVTEGAQQHKSVPISYFRVKEVKDSDNDLIMSYNHEELVCKEDRLKQWQLKGLSTALNLLYQSNALDTSEIRKDRTAIGPTALLRIFYANAHKFVLEFRAFDEARFTEMYYFTTFAQLNDDRRAKLICLLPVSTIQNRDPLVLGRTLLSQVKTMTHPAILTVVLLAKDDARVIKSPTDLYEMRDGESEKLLVSLYLAQERSSSKHAGLKLGRLDEQNPFTLPAGSGCSSSRLNSFSIGAKQFSGTYESMFIEGERFIAYDSLTRHLRIDSIGEYKLIYDLPSKRINYISQTGSKHLEGRDPDHDDKAHCAASYSSENEDDDGLYNLKSLEEVLGVDNYVGLAYLGTTQLEDGTQCLVFEREISWFRVPLIIKLNLATRPKRNDNLFLVFYFSDELLLKANTNDESFNELSYQSMWLKRIELYSRNPLLKYRTLNSQVTFSEFAWSLESMVDEYGGQNHLQSASSRSVNLFDTIECKATGQQMRLEFVIKQLDNSGSANSDEKPDKWSYWGNRKFVAQADTIEEIVMEFLVQRTRIPRSQINQLELLLPDQTRSEQAYLLARSKITAPANFVHLRTLLGWIKSLDSLPFEKYGTFVHTRSSMTRFECSLSLATNVELAMQDKIYMIYCPSVGCAYAKDMSSIEYIKKGEAPDTDPPSMWDNYYMCEVHLQKKQVGLAGIGADSYSPATIERVLSKQELSFGVVEKRSDGTVEDAVFKGMIVKVSIEKGLSTDTLGSIVRHDFCYTRNTRPTKIPSTRKSQLIQLKFEDMHHSLILCHKACHFYPDCQTYSYQKTTKTCTLSNFPKSLHVDFFNEPVADQLIDLKEDEQNCNIYTPNTLHLYKLNPLSAMSTISALTGQTDYFFSVGSIRECADLCHFHELNAENKAHYCDKFRYFPLKSVCAIEDANSFIFDSASWKKAEAREYDKTTKSDYFAALVGRDNWNSIHLCLLYDRDFEQYYVVEDWTQVELKKPPISEPSSSTTANAGESADEPTSDDASSFALSSAPVLYDLSRDDCLRECTLINEHCVMVDYCFGSINSKPTRHCNMYNLIKLSEDGSEFNQVGVRDKSSSVAALNFIEGDAKKLYTTRSNLGCTHFHLAGDNLILKIRLAEANKASLQESQNEALEELTREDLEKSNEYLKRLQELVAHASSLVAESGSFGMIVLILVSLSSGALAFVHKPLLQQKAPRLVNSVFSVTSNLRETLWCRTRRNEELLSNVQYNVELDDIMLNGK